jgi:pantoate--beta-alanine ligase
MRVVTSIKALRRLLDEARSKKKTVGFVPTMGYFHEGHASLMRQSKKENNLTVVSVFVNPKQFGPKEDFTKYPRDKKKDEKLAKKENVDIIFYPSVDEMYPTGYLTYVEVEGLSDVLCGQSRPGHFKGVATVVAKLMNIVMPHVMYLGQKDAQQALIIRKMAEDLNFPSKIKVMPTVREHDGLAMSSRNVYLTPEERAEATVLYRSLQEAKNKILSGQREPSQILENMESMIKEKSRGQADYIECVDAQSLKRVEKISTAVLISLAVRFGKTRLIDNVIVDVHAKS